MGEINGVKTGITASGKMWDERGETQGKNRNNGREGDLEMEKYGWGASLFLVGRKGKIKEEKERGFAFLGWKKRGLKDDAVGGIPGKWRESGVTWPPPLNFQIKRHVRARFGKIWEKKWAWGNAACGTLLLGWESDWEWEVGAGKWEEGGKGSLDDVSGVHFRDIIAVWIWNLFLLLHRQCWLCWLWLLLFLLLQDSQEFQGNPPREHPGKHLPPPTQSSQRWEAPTGPCHSLWRHVRNI